MDNHSPTIKAIIGLGNPGPRYANTRHNCGFLVVDALADVYQASWQHKDEMAYTTIQIHGNPVLLIKPQTFMNNSGRVIPFLKKKGIEPEQILVVHDELEKAPGTLAIKRGGSARGHNGLRSLISMMGPDFFRLRIGIGRPEEREDVGAYVLQSFGAEQDIIYDAMGKAVGVIEKLFV